MVLELGISAQKYPKVLMQVKVLYVRYLKVFKLPYTPLYGVKGGLRWTVGLGDYPRIAQVINKAKSLPQTWNILQSLQSRIV